MSLFSSSLNQKKLQSIITQFGITYLAIFGSQARGEATEFSDLDILVDYDKPIGLFKFANLQRQLSETLNKQVDLVSKKGMNKHLKPFIEKDLQVVYENS